MDAIPLLVNILYAALLVAGGLLPDLPGGGGGIPDVVLHGSAYGLQAALLSWVLASRMRPLRAIITAVLCATLFGAMVETLQVLQPARSVELKDVLANAVGACLGGITAALVRRSRL